MDVLVALAFVLLALGVAGSVLPLLPSGALSFVGVLVYWWQTGRPGILLFLALVLVALVAVAVDWLAGFVGARAGGTDTRTAVAAGIVGFALMIPTGPIGLLAGVAGTVFVLELRENQDVQASARTAAYATVGVLASAAMQLVLTVAILGVVTWVQFA